MPSFRNGTRDFHYLFCELSSKPLDIVIQLIWPNCQELRPTAFERDNIFTRIMRDYYAYDTNTNVCPSLHVIGAVAMQFTFLHLQGKKHIALHIVFMVTTILICLSTVFLKQHSIVDVFAAVPVCVLGYVLSFIPLRRC